MMIPQRINYPPNRTFGAITFMTLDPKNCSNDDETITFAF